ncbi:MAG: hypothetical protein HXS41_01105 [Theionarchaea archaeon]|nr:hypothetical protein [Theionarchaea archaeon]MBU6999250.1 hypothetical protein [Theionarchaea archaeon]MBU7019625.1 hypothetical protein [Theionarchaea archaeon]MBU7033803.1 hypothetical protein [Theionarchaea archaeon]MBU7040213.1 hypothetical protein [Theionarchaea archaeon]
MSNRVSFSVTCPHCGRKLNVKREIDPADYKEDWDQMMSDFEMEEFHCPCGEQFLGAETAQSDKLEKLLELAKTLRAEGKLDISRNSIRINLGLSDIWELIKEFKDLEGDLL